jgi:hypothetical protein
MDVSNRRWNCRDPQEENARNSVPAIRERIPRNV